MKLIRRYWWLVMGLLLMGGGVWRWQVVKTKPVKEYRVTKGPMTVTLSASGTLTAEKLADLKFQTGGRLVWVGVKEGDWIKQWQGIASLDKRTLQKTLQKELNDYMTARWNFADIRDTYNVTTDNLDSYTLSPAARRVLERSQFTLNNSVLDVEIQAVTDEMAVMIAPFSGLIAMVQKPNSGMNVTAADVIATVVDPQTMYFRAEVDEMEIGKIAVGQAVKLTFDAYPDITVENTVGEIGFAPITLSGGGTGYVVKIGLPVDNENLRYKLGMSGEAVITIAEKTGALVLPVEAMKERQGKVTVQQWVNGKIIEKEIRVGLESEIQVEILDGLQEGDVVVTDAKKK